MQPPEDPKPFALKVNEDFRGIASPEDAAMLRRPEHWDAWYDELVTIMRSFDNQLAGQKRKSAEARLEAQRNGTMDQWLEAELRVMDWRGHIFNYRRYIEVRLREIRRMRRNTPNKYQSAIDEHRETYATNPGAANERLWKFVSKQTIAQLAAHEGLTHEV